jgi:hypothetical protein
MYYLTFDGYRQGKVKKKSSLPKSNQFIFYGYKKVDSKYFKVKL